MAPGAGPVGAHPAPPLVRVSFDWSLRWDWIASELIEGARALAAQVLDRSTRTCLLHGDFEHHHPLRRESGVWAIIDPKVLHGDPEFEIAAWMCNPPGVVERDDYSDIVRRRMKICADVWRIDRQDLIARAFVGAVLSVCWSAGDATPGSAGLLRARCAATPEIAHPAGGIDDPRVRDAVRPGRERQLI